jgi:hypothetical protein
MATVKQPAAAAKVTAISSRMLITGFVGGEGEGPPAERTICPALDSI